MRGKVFSLTVFLLLAIFLMPSFASASVTEPQCSVYGTVTKDILVGQKWQLYNWTGVDQYLPFEPRDNYTVDLWNVAFSPQFTNETFEVTAGTEDTVEKYFDDNGLPYWYLKNVLSSQTVSLESVAITTLLDLPCTTSTIVFIAMKAISIGSSASYKLESKIFLESAGTTYKLVIRIYDGDTDWKTTLYTSGNEVIYGFDYAQDKAIFIQLPIEDAFARIWGNSIDFDKITKMQFILYVSNSTTATDEATEASVRFGLVTEDEIYINSETYMLNTTSSTMQIPATVGDVLNVYGANVTTIHDVQIPFNYTVEPERTYHDESFKVSYVWRYKLPASTELTYSNTALNFTLNKDGSKFDYLYVKGSDMLSNILDKTAGTELTLVTGLAPGDQYDVETRVQYSENEYYELAMAIQLAWWSPRSWLDKLLAILLAIVNFFGGIGATYIKRLRAKIRTPKRM